MREGVVRLEADFRCALKQSLTFEVGRAPLAVRPVEAEGRNELDRGVRFVIESVLKAYAYHDIKKTLIVDALEGVGFKVVT